MKQAFTSIRYPIAVDVGLGRLAQETNYAEHVDQLIRQVLLTNPGERINRPDAVNIAKSDVDPLAARNVYP